MNVGEPLKLAQLSARVCLELCSLVVQAELGCEIVTVDTVSQLAGQYSQSHVDTVWPDMNNGHPHYGFTGEFRLGAWTLQSILSGDHGAQVKTAAKGQALG